ncbi:hypothetical protein [Tsukamurella tyrosinosolvens]|uniref:hypothetical protein n=1 Tax=Tsukamurella tyrosinosolvens TaxID=57704 RepID=UPI003463619F
MSAVESRLAATLAKHRPEFGDSLGWWECSCRPVSYNDVNYTYAAHLAAVIASSDDCRSRTMATTSTSTPLLRCGGLLVSLLPPMPGGMRPGPPRRLRKGCPAMSSDPTDLIHEGREKLAAATPGDWLIHDRGIGVEVHAPNGADSADPDGTHCLTDDDVFDERYVPGSTGNAELIVWARNNLAAVLEALRAEQKDCEIIANALDEERAYSAHLLDEVTRAKEWQGIGVAVRFAEFQEAQRWAEWFAAEKEYYRVNLEFENETARLNRMAYKRRVAERDEARAALAEANATIERVRALVEKYDDQCGSCGSISGGRSIADAIRRAIEGPAT